MDTNKLLSHDRSGAISKTSRTLAPYHKFPGEEINFRDAAGGMHELLKITSDLTCRGSDLAR